MDGLNLEVVNWHSNGQIWAIYRQMNLGPLASLEIRLFMIKVKIHNITMVAYCSSKAHFYMIDMK